jgi:hypothetical protein
MPIAMRSRKRDRNGSRSTCDGTNWRQRSGDCPRGSASCHAPRSDRALLDARFRTRRARSRTMVAAPRTRVSRAGGPPHGVDWRTAARPRRRDPDRDARRPGDCESVDSHRVWATVGVNAYRQPRTRTEVPEAHDTQEVTGSTPEWPTEGSAIEPVTT